MAKNEQSDTVSRPSHRQSGRKSHRKGIVSKSMRAPDATQSPTVTPVPTLTSSAQTSTSEFDSEPPPRPSPPESSASQDASHSRPGLPTVPLTLYASTTDDEMPSSRCASAADSDSFHHVVSLKTQGATLAVPRRRSPRADQLVTTLAVAQTPASLAADDEWDYSETEWWGWVILVTTWLVFVIGMGSCLGVWSWAWDVGETPYAPPELEDDPTLPITGYYPALLVCTAVMAWVWVVVAWVGMKYFRHSKMAADDG